MGISPPSGPRRLEVLPGGRASQPPQPQLPKAPQGRCKQALWQALLSGMVYGSVGYGMYRTAVLSDEDSSQNKNRFQLGMGHVLLDPMKVLMGIGVLEFIRQRGAVPQQIPVFLNPRRVVQEVFSHCTNRNINGGALIAKVLEKSPRLTRLKFEPTYGAHAEPIAAHAMSAGAVAKGVAIAGAAMVAGAISAFVELFEFRAVPMMEVPFSSDQNLNL